MSAPGWLPESSPEDRGAAWERLLNLPAPKWLRWVGLLALVFNALTSIFVASLYAYMVGIEEGTLATSLFSARGMAALGFSLLTLFCLLAIFFWNKGKRPWPFVVLVLAAFFALFNLISLAVLPFGAGPQAIFGLGVLLNLAALIGLVRQIKAKPAE